MNRAELVEKLRHGGDFRCRHEEVDQDGNMRMVFVEVVTRRRWALARWMFGERALQVREVPHE